MLRIKEAGLVNIGSWKTKTIVRVCHSAKAAETRALEEAVELAINVARVIKEVYMGKIDLKFPVQIPVNAFTDSKSLSESIHNSRQYEEKLLRNSIAARTNSLSQDINIRTDNNKLGLSWTKLSQSWVLVGLK